MRESLSPHIPSIKSINPGCAWTPLYIKIWVVAYQVGEEWEEREWHFMTRAAEAGTGDRDPTHWRNSSLAPLARGLLSCAPYPSCPKRSRSILHDCQWDSFSSSLAILCSVGAHSLFVNYCPVQLLA